MPVSSFQRKDGFLLVRQYLYSWTLLFLALLSDSSTYTSRIAYAEIYHSMKYCKFSRAFKQSILEFTSRVNDRRYLASVVKIFLENGTMQAVFTFYSQAYRLDLWYIYFRLSMQKYHQQHANRAVTNKITTELVSAEESIY